MSNPKSHIMRTHPLYLKWKSLKARCYNINVSNYHNYGGRGIKVCDEWSANFMTFYRYMMSLPNALKKGYSIDRIDNDGNYEIGNMRWANAHMQIVNRRISKRNTSGYVGVSFHKIKAKWVTHITVNLKRMFLGYYSDIKDAAKARDQYIIDNKLFEYPLQVLTLND